MPALNDVLRPLGVSVVAKQDMGNGEWLLLIARSMVFPNPPPEQSIIVYAERPDNPDIDDEEADAIKRRFEPPPTARFIDIIPPEGK